ncbi:M23 family metallopeptidase [Staphylococcus simiae]|nr:M23 family metallopeptidase [Staphylococcus simiae]MBO1198904.1 M23 family metallopeptidase [Staphylococcus simiae]MBO1201070.1 M23 family metallopeptidase [Staphylococcus simiae]MBO1203304.1 M23 family metallopeptidase [Staphylococcus simiae]MBO1210747.1 M23 family metallopeptidase [Staphylococcus simiae]MBO1229408.1 M23 family metallopeptidase [Staphylococcus simiae]
MKKTLKYILGIVMIVAIFGSIYHYKDDMQQWWKQLEHHNEATISKEDKDWHRMFNGSRQTESFGEYKHNDFDSKHYGIDYAVPKNTPIKAVTNGTVTRTFDNQLGGKVLQISEDNGQYHQWYMHLNRYNVEEGDHVKVGDIIAYSGNTGEQTTGPHIHFQRMKGGVGNAYAENPESFIKQLPDGERSLYDLK